MKQLITLDDSAVAKQTKDFFCAIRFDSNKKANFEAVVKMCKKASFFAEEIVGKKSMFLVGFAATKAETKLASVVTSELHSASWKYTLFANGRVQKNKWAFLNTLDCMAVAADCKDHRAHCHKILENPFDVPSGSMTVSFGGPAEKEPPPELWLLPCAELDGHVNFDKRLLADPAAQLDAAAVKRNVHRCPFYRPEDFKKIEQVEEKKAPKGKRFW